MAHFEVEVKTLLGNQENAEKLKAQLVALDPACVCKSKNRQLNHYFSGGDIEVLYQKVEALFDDQQKTKLKAIIEMGADFSVRTRQKDDEVLLVVKASVDDGNGINAVSRLEFEEPIAIPLDALDALVLEAGYEYDSKWSREREEYTARGMTVCIDRNAGYGYLAEFEKVVPEESLLGAVRNEIDTVMAELGLAELPHDRHDRMYAFYKANWPEYYGTEKTFIIE